MLRQLPSNRWTYELAAHLLNRAGFGGAPREIEELRALGLEGAVARLVDDEQLPDPTPDPDWAARDPGRLERLRQVRQAGPEERRRLQREERERQRDRMIELRGWWLGRMASGPRPLREKLTLFWHGHFATSIEKVREARLMWRQNDLFRRLGMGRWEELLIEAGKDPAMLIWLDQARSRKEHPNENFAREVMELFALGEGHYTEKDITEGARALTGWAYDGVAQEFVERPNWHDRGVKMILGKSGNFNGEEFLGLVIAQPQAARFITGKLWNYFAGAPPSASLNAALAETFRQAGNHFRPLLRTLFLSEEFYAPDVVRAQVKSPVQWLVGSVRVLERPLPPPPTCYALTRNLGQDLFAPPNVKGWDGGLSWITTNNLLSRYNEAATLVQGARAAREPDRGRAARWLGGVEPERLFTEAERQNGAALSEALQRRLLQGRLRPKNEAVLLEFIGLGKPDEARILAAIRLVMSTPEYQLT